MKGGEENRREFRESSESSEFRESSEELRKYAWVRKIVPVKMLGVEVRKKEFLVGVVLALGQSFGWGWCWLGWILGCVGVGYGRFLGVLALVLGDFYWWGEKICCDWAKL